MARSSQIRDDVVESLEAQLATLRKEVSGLRKTWSRRSARAYDSASETASEVYEDLAERWADALPQIRKGARVAERSARDNPAVTAAVGIAVVGLLALLVFRRQA
jgi:uncharacterized protein YukE